MTRALDLQADALLRTVIELHGGDLRAACLMLCASVTLLDLDGDDFERALHRAIGVLFSRPALVPPLRSVDASHLLRSVEP